MSRGSPVTREKFANAKIIVRPPFRAGFFRVQFRVQSFSAKLHTQTGNAETRPVFRTRKPAQDKGKTGNQHGFRFSHLVPVVGVEPTREAVIIQLLRGFCFFVCSFVCSLPRNRRF